MRSPDRLRVGIVEDDVVMGGSLVQRLNLEGYEPLWWRTGREALDAMSRSRPDLLVCDIRLPDMTGEDVFAKVRPLLQSTPVLFITAFGDVAQAVRLMREGADEYITKPFEMEEFLSRINELANWRAVSVDSGRRSLGVSEAMRGIEDLLRQIADVESTVLFSGESGSGKEVAARFLHHISPHGKAPFIAVNCAAIPSELMESELFGHEKGSFTGAHDRHLGYAERARDGVLFLDEVGELSMSLQAKLLRLVQDRDFSRVGGEEQIEFQARLICATNADLKAAIKGNRFREDLFYRINVIPVVIPPLREHPEDILALVRGYLSYYASRFRRDVHSVTVAAEEAVLAHDWPGNVRELRNRVERAVVLARKPRVSARDLFPEFAGADRDSSEMPTLKEAREQAEHRHIERVLALTGGQTTAAAELLGISRTTLWEKMRKLGLSGEEES
jgi:DNA-binding NtrC family response regulator